MLKPINFKKWIDEHRDLLKPPVGNKLVWEDREFMVMVVGGPNTRTDFHINPGEEFFYQVEGNIVLTLMQGGEFHDIPISEGEIFLLPPKIPHSPKRPSGTVGLVLERKRLNHELDGFVWYCANCKNKLYEEFFHLTNLVTQLPPVFENFYRDKSHAICKKCGTEQK